MDQPAEQSFDNQSLDIISIGSFRRRGNGIDGGFDSEDSTVNQDQDWVDALTTDVLGCGDDINGGLDPVDLV